MITLNDGFLNTAPFKAAGWRTNHALSKRSHSPPIPTAIRSEYFQAPRARFALEEEVEDGGLLTGDADTMAPSIATKRRRRREHEEDDSSDLSDDSEEEQDNRAGQQIKFAKLPVRTRAGSSPLQSSNLRQMTTASPPRAGAGTRRGSQSALDTVKERVRRDTVTSSEVSSENEFDNSGFHHQREAAREAGRMAAAKASRRRARSNDEMPGSKLHDTIFHAEDEDESDNSDLDDAFGGEHRLYIYPRRRGEPASPGVTYGSGRRHTAAFHPDVDHPQVTGAPAKGPRGAPAPAAHEHHPAGERGAAGQHPQPAFEV